MSHRRKFLQRIGLATTGAFLSFRTGTASDKDTPAMPIVRNPDEGETYFVRENTPLTIKFSKQIDGINSISMIRQEIYPGAQIPIHKHLNEDESFLILKGKGLFALDSGEVEITAGSTAFVPRQNWHGIRNTGTENLEILFSFSPAGFEGYFKEVGTPKGQKFQPKSEEELAIIMKRYGMVYKK